MGVPAIALGVVLTTVSAFAATDPSARCCSTKLRAAGAREKQLFRCWAQAAARGSATADAACIAAAGTSLARQFTRAEDAGGCAAVGDASVVAADLVGLASGIATTLRPTSAVSACAARKLKLAGRLASSLARAFAGYAPRPADHLGDLDPIVTELGQQLAARYAQLESAGGCSTSGDAVAIWQRLSAGLFVPAVPDGILRASMRVCPACGDNVQGGSEQCDGFDASTCNAGICRPGCVCATCGDGVKDPGETCDGADAAACAGLCQPNCTCPTPVCGNGVKEAGEACDPPVLAGCASCQPDCTCGAPVCGNGVVESGEQCDGAVCAADFTIAGCRPPGAGGCTCCGYPCYQFGCCDPEETCMPSPSTGYCFKFRCDQSSTCNFGYVCTDLRPTYPFNACLPGLGAGCFFPDFNGGFTVPCATPGAVCQQGLCCLPSGTACSSGGCCAGLTCSGGTCS